MAYAKGKKLGMTATMICKTVSKAMGRNMGVRGPSGQKGKLPMRRVKP